MMATPLPAEPPARNSPFRVHFPSQTPTDPDVLGQRAGEASWLRPRSATSQSQRRTSLDGRLAALCEEEGGWPSRPGARGPVAAATAASRAPLSERRGTGGLGRGTGAGSPPCPRPRLEHYVLRCVTGWAAAHSGLPCGGLLKREQSLQDRVKAYLGLADRY